MKIAHRIADVGTITAIATPTGGTQEILALCPMQVVADSNNNYQVDDSDQVLSYVRFGLWDHAFSTINPPTPITTTLSTPTLNRASPISGPPLGGAACFLLRRSDFVGGGKKGAL